MKRPSRHLLLAAATLAAASSAQADNGTWNVDANGTWSTTTNWAGGTVADGSGFTANFTHDITANRTVTLGAPQTIGNIVFDDAGATGDSAWTITGGTLTLAGGTPTITTHTNATIASILAGTNGLTKAGAGALTLSGSNTYTGATAVNAGTLTLNYTGGPLGTGGFTVNSGATLNINNASGTTWDGFATPITIAGGAVSLGGSNTVVLYGGATIDMTGGSLSFGSNWAPYSDFNVTTHAAASTATITGSANFTSYNPALNFVVERGAAATDLSVSMPLGGTGALTKSGAGILELGGLLGGGTYAGNIAVNAGTLVFTNTAAQALNGVISGSGTIMLKSGVNGTVTFGGADSNTFSGTLNIDTNGTANTRTITLNKTGGAVAIGDNAVINFGLGTAGQTNLRMSQNEQFGSGVVINFGNVVGQYSRFDLMGTSQTLAGINAGTVATQMGAVIQNRELGNKDSNRGTSTLTLNGAGTYLYNGWMRDSDNGASATNQLALVKNGAGTQTLVGNQITYTGATTINAGTLVLNNTTAFGSNITLGASDTPTLQLDGTWTLGKVIGGGSADASVEKIGAGTVTLTAANTYTGDTIVTGGTLALSYATQNNDKIASNSSLTFGGGSLSVTGHASAATTQSVAGTTLNPGAATITVTKNASTQDTTLNLNTITRNAGGTMNVVYAGTGTGAASVTTDNLNDATGILGGWATVGGSDWAINSTGAADGRITAYTGYSTTLVGTAMSDTLNQKLTAGLTLTGAHTHNSLKIENPTASQTLALGSNVLTLTSGGLLVTGANAYTISGTAGATGLTAGDGSGAYDLIVHQYNTGGLTISAVIGDNGANATGLIQAGTGTLTLTGINTYTGATTIGAGTLGIGGAGQLGGGNYSGDIVNNGTLLYNSTADQALTGTITGTGALTKQGSGTLTLTGANYTGSTTISGGTLALSGEGNRLASTATLNFSGAGTLDIGSTNQTLANLTFGASATDTITGSGALNITGVTAVLVGYTSGASSVNTTLNLNGGTTTITPTLYIGHSAVAGNGFSSTGTVTVAAGATLNGSTIDLAYSSYSTGNFAPVTSGTLTVNGSVNVATLILSDLTTGGHGTSGSSATVNLNTGATLAATTINPGASQAGTITRTFNFNGGTIRNLGSGDLTISAFGGTTSSFVLGAAGTPTFDISSGHTGTVSQAMSGSGSLTKIGAGTLTLNANNTYSGGTTISAGTLIAGNVGALGTGAATVNTGGTLHVNGLTLANAMNFNGGSLAGGTGSTLNGAITVGASGVTVATGATLALNGNMTLATGAITTNGSGLVANAGTLTLGGSGILDLGGAFDTYSGGTYTLISGTFSGTFANASNVSGYSTSVWSKVSFDNATGNLVFTAVPEPSTYGLIGAGALAAVAFVRRRRRHAGAVA